MKKDTLLKIINKFAAEIARRDINALRYKVDGMTFEQAFKTLDGFNLEQDISTIGTNKEFLGASLRFDCNFKDITATIFKTEDGMCEVMDNFVEVWTADRVEFVRVTNF